MPPIKRKRVKRYAPYTKKAKRGGKRPAKRRRLVRLIKRVARSALETKWNTSIGGALLTGAPSTTYIVTNFTVAQGDSAITRDGDKIFIRNLRLDGTVYSGGATPDDYNYVRMIVTWAPETAVTTTDLPALAGGLTPPHAPWPIASTTSTRFKILVDKVFYVVKDASTMSGRARWPIHMNIPVRKTQDYGAGTTIQRGHLQMWWVSDSTVVSHPNYELDYKLFFKDI